MNPSPYFRFAKGLSSAVIVIIGVVLACGYTFGKRITNAEAAAADQGAGDTSLSQAASTKPNSDTGSGQPASAKSSSEARAGESPAGGSGDNVVPGPSAGDASHPEVRASGMGSVEGVRGDDVPLSDADSLEFNATAYCLTGYTAAGIATARGMIAADPRILPLGSVVHIRAGDYSGTYLVLDTGAKIKGRRIDIYMPDRREAVSFGRRPVRLKVIGKVRPSHLRPR